MSLQRRFLEVTQDANIGEVRQPPSGYFVEMSERFKGSAVEQAGFDIEERFFYFAFRRSRRLHLICAVDEEPFESHIRFTPGTVASLRS